MTLLPRRRCFKRTLQEHRKQLRMSLKPQFIGDMLDVVSKDIFTTP